MAFLPLSGYKTIHIHRHLFIAIILTIKCTEELGVGVDGHKGKRGGAIIAADAEFLCCRLSHPTVAIVFAKTIFMQVLAQLKSTKYVPTILTSKVATPTPITLVHLKASA